MATHKLVAGAIFIGSPYVLWLVLFLVAHYAQINMRRIVPWIRAIRWFTSLITGVLILMYLVRAGFPPIYAYLSLGFSSGVVLIDTWAIKKFAPERMSRFDSLAHRRRF
jgi:hypothetical protein